MGRLRKCGSCLPSTPSYTVRCGVLTVGAATEASALLPEARFGSQAIALFVGNEGKGISPTLRSSLDQLVAIPMGASIDSFSVNAATAVILYAITHSPSTGSNLHAGETSDGLTW